MYKVLFLAILLPIPAAAADWKNVDQAIGRAGTVQPDGAYKVGFPRGDLTVTAEGVTIKPALALGGWAAFNNSGVHAIAMGDLVLLETEVNPVIAALQDGGIDVTAVHNHLLGESPHVMYVHFNGHGDAAKLATTLKNAISLTKTPAPSAPAAATLDLPTADLDRILGHAGKANGGVYQFGVPRANEITEHGMVIPASMGLATSISFQPTGNGRAAITGDFVLIGSEVNPVIGALRAGGIAVTALHSHMLDDTPRLFFMHFWGNDDATKLATTLRSALDHVNIRKK